MGLIELYVALVRRSWCGYSCSSKSLQIFMGIYLWKCSILLNTQTELTTYLNSIIATSIGAITIYVSNKQLCRKKMKKIRMQFRNPCKSSWHCRFINLNSNSMSQKSSYTRYLLIKEVFCNY